MVSGGCGGCGVGSARWPSSLMCLVRFPSVPNGGGGFMSQWSKVKHLALPSFKVRIRVVDLRFSTVRCRQFPIFHAGKGGCALPQMDSYGSCVGGCTPQVTQMNQLLQLSQGLSSAQLLTLVQGLQERIRTQGRDMPEVFGQRPVEGFGGKRFW